MEWFPDWRNEVCAVIGSGPSVTLHQVEQLRGRCRVIVVNTSFRMAPWANALYAADPQWWRYNEDAQGFAGLKITQDERLARALGLHCVTMADKVPARSRITIARPGHIGNGGNGGFQAINLAVQFGARRQLWLGLDFCGEHWHGPHPDGLRNPRPTTLEKWAAALDAQAAILSGLGVQVFNCSEVSMLAAYPKLPIADALAQFRSAAVAA